MIVIRMVKFEFDMDDEPFALDLYRHWDAFCRSGFIDVAERLLIAEDQPETAVHIERLEVDLGTLAGDEFYEKFGKRFEERLKEALHGLLRGSRGQQMQCYAVTQEYNHQFLYYLLHGYPAWDCGEQFDFKESILRMVKEEIAGFRRFLLAEGYRESLRKRLIFRLEDEMLCTLVTCTTGSEAGFINRYTVFLVRNYPNIQHPTVAVRDYRDTVWLLVLTYIWAVNRGPGSRKELLRYTLRGLAAHLGIKVYVLMQYIVQGVEELLAGDTIRHELLVMLQEIDYEEKLNLLVQEGDITGIREVPGRLLEKIFTPEFLGQAAESEEDKLFWVKELRNLLTDVRRRQQLLNGLKEEEIGGLVKILEPREAEFIVSYAHALEMSKEKGCYEGKAGPEFRFVKWDFIFVVLLEKPSGNMDRCQFVSDVLRRLAAHYGLDYGRLLEYFQKEQECLPEWLTGVLYELEAREELAVMEKNRDIIRPEYRQRYVRLLIHPLSCRQLLKSLGEPDIRKLAEIVLPQEKIFILDYALCLENGKERGMFEGRAGSEFGRLKWEFIFRLSLTHVFNRKYFTLGVLQELASHYALNVRDLLEYFHQYLQEETSGQFPDIWEVVCELWQDIQQVETGTELHRINESEMRLWLLERYILTGRKAVDTGDIYTLFMDLKVSVPEELAKRIRRLPLGLLRCKVEQEVEGIKFYAALILWWLERYPCKGQEWAALNGMLQAALNGSGKMGVSGLRQLLIYCLEDQAEEFLHSPDPETGEGRMLPTDFPALLDLLADYHQKEVKEFVRDNQEELKKAILSVPSGKWGNKLKDMTLRDSGLRVFLKLELGLEWSGNGENESRSPDFRVEDLRHWLLKHTSFRNEKWLDNRKNCLQILEKLDNGLYLQLWIERTGNMEIRRLAAGWFRLEKQIRLNGPERQIRQLLAHYTLPEYANFSLAELYRIFVRQLWKILNDRQKQRFIEVVKSGQEKEDLWGKTLSRLIGDSKQNVSGGSIPGEREGLETDGTLCIGVRNAGLVLFSPWFVQLFKRLEFLDEEEKEFATVEMQVHAVFVLQALVDGTEPGRLEEQELFLNRLFVGLSPEEALPAFLELTEREKELVCSLTENLRASWPKMKNTSLGGLRQAFLQREAILEEGEKEWKLTVNPLGMDVLLDNLSWGFTMIKLPWMEKRVRVEWRS